MRYLLVTRDRDVVKATDGAFQPDDVLDVYADWREALDAAKGADMMFVDLVATLSKPGKIAGYEEFAQEKMAHADAAHVPLVLIPPPDGYELDFFVGYPNFVFAHLSRPLSFKLFRRATTWI